jgi:outer membrane protein TolC
MAAYESRSLEQPGLTAFLQSAMPNRQWPPENWDLTALTLAAFYYQPELDVFRARLGIAQTDIQSAGQYPNPTLSLIPAFNSTTTSDAGISPWIVDSSLDFPYQTAGKRDLRIAEAKSLSEAARLELAQAAWTLRSRIRNAMINLYEARQLQDMLETQCRFQQQNVNLLLAVRNLGQVSPFEVYQGRVALHAAELERFDAQKKHTLALGSLAEAVGVPRKSLEGISISLDWCDKLPSSLPDAETRRKAMLNRADLLALLAHYQASQFALQLEIAQQYPDITIGPGYSFDQSENKWALGVSLTLPVFNQNQGAIAAAEKRREEAAAAFNTLQAAILHKIDQGVENYTVTLKQYSAVSALVREQEQKIALQNKMLSVGEIGQQEILAGQLELNNDYRLLLQSRIDAQQTLGQLEDAMQSPVDFPAWEQIILQTEKQERGEP